MSDQRRPAGGGLLRLYPRSWRDRYEDEMLGVLDDAPVDWGGRVDLFRGAVDASIHAWSRGPIVAAFVSGAAWTLVGVLVLGQPVPPDWPGHLVEGLPLALVGCAAGFVALVGCWARASDRGGRLGTVAGIAAVVGQLAWLAALSLGLAGIADTPTLALGQALGAVGCMLVGLMLLRAADERIGSLLVLPPALLLFGWPAGWLAFGLAWNLIGVLLARELTDDRSDLRTA
jgi:hypothetical protein